MKKYQKLYEEDCYRFHPFINQICSGADNITVVYH